MSVLNGSLPEHFPVSVLVRSKVSGQGGSKLCTSQLQPGPFVGQVYGSGFMAHCEPAGLVPVLM
jgi:hypothetical protein